MVLRRALPIPIGVLAIAPSPAAVTGAGHGWKVSGDLRPSSDVYVARLGAKQVRWRF